MSREPILGGRQGPAGATGPIIGSDAGDSIEVRVGNGKTIELTVDGTPQLTADGDGITLNQGVGFNNVAPSPRPTITGSRGGNAALASLLTALDAMGLITDNTT